MVKYNAHLNDKARQLRKHVTDSEAALWSRLRKRQLLGIRFYRQKPIGAPIVDFVAPRATLGVAGDGAQHLGGDHPLNDRRRDGDWASLGLKGLRFTSREGLRASDAVVEAIDPTVADQWNPEIPPGPPLIKGG